MTYVVEEMNGGGVFCFWSEHRSPNAAKREAARIAKRWNICARVVACRVLDVVDKRAKEAPRGS